MPILGHLLLGGGGIKRNENFHMVSIWEGIEKFDAFVEQIPFLLTAPPADNYM